MSDRPLPKPVGNSFEYECGVCKSLLVSAKLPELADRRCRRCAPKLVKVLAAAWRAATLRADTDGYVELSHQSAAGQLLEAHGGPREAMKHVPTDSAWWDGVKQLLGSALADELLEG